MRGDLVSAGKAAATSALTSRVDALTDSLRDRAERVRNPEATVAEGAEKATETGRKAADGGQFTVRCSKDLQQWKICGHVLDNIPDWIHKESPGTVDLWAPDISYFLRRMMYGSGQEENRFC